jgi:hypothetical protein
MEIAHVEIPTSNSLKQKAIPRRGCSQSFRLAAMTTEEGAIYQLTNSGR